MSSNFASRRGRSEKVFRLRDVTIPDVFFRRYSTGSEVLDQIFGGEELPGIMPSSTIFFTGDPGTGKSTMALQLAESFTSQNLRVLYNIGEESEEMIKLRADRLKLRGDFEVSKYTDVEELAQHCLASGVEILFQDSLQTFEDPEVSDAELMRVATRRLVNLAQDGRVTVFLIGHVTKSGAFAGPNKLAHDVDVRAHLSLNRDTGNRIFTLMKNRQGPAGMPYEFMMGQGGLDFRAAAGTEEFGEVGPTEKKQRATKMVRQLLEEGRMLSGYSHEEEPELQDLGLSGNFMRATLREVVGLLRREGKEIVEVVHNRRAHFRLAEERKLEAADVQR